MSDEVLAEFAYTIKADGTFALDEPERFKRWKARHPSTRGMLVFHDEATWRNNGQLRRLRWLERLFSDYSGYTPKEIHEEFHRRFSSYDHRLPDGTLETRVRRCNGMTERQMKEHIELVERFVVEQGVVIPPRKERAA